MRWTCTPLRWPSWAGGLLSLLLLCYAPLVRAQGQVADSTELRVLRQLYASTGGDQWSTRTNWPTTPAQWQAATLDQASTWYGVGVSAGDVVGLNLQGNHLRGPLPAAFGELRLLQGLYLAYNELTGPLPASMAQLTLMNQCALNNNLFSGELTGLFDHWYNVQNIALGNNHFQGSVPGEVGQLPRLYSFDVENNELSGRLPAALGASRTVWRISLQNNRLIGGVPGSWGQMSSLRQLFLDYNQLTGPLTDSLANLTYLDYLGLSHNQIRGSIPLGFTRFANLAQLNLSYNQLSGSVPANLNIYMLLLQNNHLTGELPASYGTTHNWQILFDNNNITRIPYFAQPLGYPNLQLGLTGNYLAFDSYEPNQVTPGQYQFWDYGQRTPPGDTVQAMVGQAAELDGRIGGAHNQYQWLRLVGGQWVEIPGQTQPTLHWSRLTLAEVGTYCTRVTNEWVPGITLYGKSHYLDAVPYLALARNLPDDANPARTTLADPLPGLDAPAGTAAPDLNYVRSWSPRVALTDAARVPQAPTDSVALSTQYLDGLGRPLQTVLRQASPGRRDMVQPQAYDNLDREPRQFLPYPVETPTGPAGSYRPQALAEQDAFYRRVGPGAGTQGPLPAGDATRGVARTGAAYAETLFEASPLGRVLAQGAAGEVWQLSQGHVLERLERPNTAADSVPRFQPGYDPRSLDPGYQGFYTPGELWGTEVSDAHGPNEPGAQGYKTIEWKDKLGQVVLKQVEGNRVHAGGQLRSRWLRTAYVYDDFQRLRFVLQPEATKRVLAPPTSQPSALPFLFHYRYDGRGRQIAKQVPGQDGETRVVYDQLDRPVLSQDAQQRTRQEWSWTKYDALGRVVLTGLVTRPDPVGQASTAIQENYLGVAYDQPGFTAFDFSPVVAGAHYTGNHNFTHGAWYDAQQQFLAPFGDGTAPAGAVFVRVSVQTPAAPTAMLIQDGPVPPTFRPYVDRRPAQPQPGDNVLDPGDARDALQTLAAADTATAHQYEQRTASLGQYPHGLTTDQSFPQLGQQGFSAGQVLTVTYYDDYDFDNNGTADVAYDPQSDAQFPSGQAPVADVLRTQGLSTRTKTRVLGVAEHDAQQAAWLTTTTFYDERARPVQVQSTNARQGLDLLTTQLDFTGKVVQSVAVHQGPSLATPLRVAEFFTYDHTGRLLTTSQQLPGEAQPTQVAAVQYNEIGQATRKTLGTGRLTQHVDYAYNIRGWLTSLNDPAQPDPSDLFSLSLHYEAGFTKGYEQYNGNLTGQTWRGRDGVQRAYGYVYDPLNRLLQGDFVARAGGSQGTLATGTAWNQELDNYRLSFVSYDDNGNINTLRRRSLLQNATSKVAKQYGAVDNLSYAYVGNRLQAVDDAVTGNQLARPATYHGAPTSLAGDFQEASVRLSQEYLYDANGNLTQDKNKGITGIAYNHLNLPRQIHFGTGADSIVFRYSAAGQKVAKLVYQTGQARPQRTDYLGPYQYEQDSLRFFPHAEGRVLRFVSYDPAGQAHVSYQREYTLKDHLGNLRLAYRLGQTRIYSATLEQDSTTRKRETQQFDSLSVSIPVAQQVGMSLARTGTYAALLNAGGASPQPIGPLTQITVQKGDTLRVSAPGRYQQAVPNHSFAFSLASFVASLLQPAPQGAPPRADGSKRGGLPLLQVGLNAGSLAALTQTSNGVPKGYLRVLVFNSDSVLVDQRTVQLSQAALNHYEVLQTGFLPMQQDGYVSVYVGNESAVDVLFDDVQVEYRQGLLVQETQYDPAGLELAGLAPPSPGIRGLNNYRFNGKEFQADLGLAWNHQDWRFFDPQLLRWHAGDPELENGQESWTPYSFGYDNAVRYADADGRCPGGCPPVAGVVPVLVAGATIVGEVLGAAAAVVSAPAVITGVVVVGAVVGLGYLVTDGGTRLPSVYVDNAMPLASLTRSGTAAQADNESAARAMHNTAGRVNTTGGKPVITIPRSKYPEAAGHLDEVEAATGKPVSGKIDRSGAKARRKEAMQGKPTVSGKDRDEVPPAILDTGGKGASVKPISSKDNRGAGSHMGKQMAKHPNGTEVVVKSGP